MDEQIRFLIDARFPTFRLLRKRAELGSGTTQENATGSSGVAEQLRKVQEFRSELLAKSPAEITEMFNAARAARAKAEEELARSKSAGRDAMMFWHAPAARADFGY